MKGYFGLGQLSSEEKSDILDQHRSVYNGYQTMQPQVSNTQPLTVYDFAGDKDGMVVNNKGEVKKYTNFNINEQVESESMCEQCGSQMTEGMCEQCGESEMSEGEGKLDDIYNVEDLSSDSGFDYIEGGSNSTDTFKGMHKNLYKEEDYEDDDNEDDGFLDDELDEDATDDKPYEKGKTGMKASRARASFEPTPKEKEILEKLFGQYGNDIPPIVIRYLRKLPRKVFTKRLEDLGLLDLNSLKNKKDVTEQGGNADDMDVDSVDSAYDFVSDGPLVGEYETMESAFADDELDEVDVSGSQGVYGDMDSAYDFDSEGPGMASFYQTGSEELTGDMDPAYDFDSKGPGKAGPYQRFSFEGKEDEDDMYDEDELNIDFEKFDPRDKSWEEIKTYTGDDEYSDIDEDIVEDFKTQKNKISEMFNRMSKYN